MFVSYLFRDDVRRPPPSADPEAGIIRDPSWADIESAIRSLDGDKVRLIVVSESEPTDRSHFPFGGRGMMIGGGGETGLYVCQVGGEDGDELDVLDTMVESGIWLRSVNLHTLKILTVLT